MNENKMETMQVNKLLITMEAPMVLSMLIGALYNVVDSLFVSHYGENALSAVSLAFPIQNIIIATGTGIGVGINALLSRFLGEKKQKKVNQTALHGIILGIGFYILVLLFGIFCVKGFYMVQTNDTEIISMGVDYLTVICVFGYFGLPEMGTKGAPIATVVGQIIAMSSIMCFGINKLLLNFSTTSTAVFGAYFKLQTFVYMATFGLNNALIPIVAFNLGAKHADRIKKVIRLSGAYSALIGLVGLIIMEMLPVQLISAFAPSEEMFSLGVTALRILGFSFVFGGVSVMTCYALQGFSRGISSLIISALRQVIILLPLASILGKAIGINGIWWSFLISETVTVTRNVRHRFQSSNPQK